MLQLPDDERQRQRHLDCKPGYYRSQSTHPAKTRPHPQTERPTRPTARARLPPIDWSFPQEFAWPNPKAHDSRRRVGLEAGAYQLFESSPNLEPGPPPYLRRPGTRNGAVLLTEAWVLLRMNCSSQAGRSIRHVITMQSVEKDSGPTLTREASAGQRWAGKQQNKHMDSSNHQKTVGSEQGKFALVVEIQWIWEGWDFSILQVPQNLSSCIAPKFCRLWSMVAAVAPFPWNTRRQCSSHACQKHCSRVAGTTPRVRRPS